MFLFSMLLLFAASCLGGWLALFPDGRDAVGAALLGAGLLNFNSSFAAPLLTPHLSAAQAAAPQANAWVEINVQAFEQNIQTLQKQLQDKSQICAVMKADAYGHGLLRAATALASCSCVSPLARRNCFSLQVKSGMGQSSLSSKSSAGRSSWS